MKRFVIAFSLLFSLFLPLAAPAARPTPAVIEKPVPRPPAVAARSYILMDFDSGQVLAERDADSRHDPASLTKIMTAYVVFHELAGGNLRLEDEVTVSKKAWRMPGSRMFIEVGKKVPVEALIKGMLVDSGNDATVALAEHIAGSEDSFADYMNRYAKALGLTGSHFVNATGLPDPNHYITARDAARVTRALIREFPEYYKWFAIRKMTFNGITQHNRNRLLWRDESVDGVKTGHTQSAGYCLVASARRDGMRLISVVMGTRSDEARASTSQALLNYGFRFFETHRLYAGGARLTDARVWKGAREQIPLGLQQPLYVTIPRGRYKRLKADMKIRQSIMAPVKAGTQLGEVNVHLDGKTLVSVPLVALKDDPEGSLWQRMVDEVLLYFE